MKKVLYWILIFFCVSCNFKNNKDDYSIEKLGYYPIFTNETLRKDIIEYVDTNNKDNEGVRNIVYVNKIIDGDTSSYKISEVSLDSLLTKPINLMTKIDNIYVGYYDAQINDLGMTVAGIITFMAQDFPFLRGKYGIYQSGYYPVITNEILHKTIIEYANKNIEPDEQICNWIRVHKTINGDTTSYSIDQTCFYFLIHNRVNLMTKVNKIYVGYYNEQLNVLNMTVEGVVNFYPFMKSSYKGYRRRLNDKSQRYDPISVFDVVLINSDIYILKFVNEKLVEKNHLPYK